MKKKMAFCFALVTEEQILLINEAAVPKKYHKWQQSLV